MIKIRYMTKKGDSPITMQLKEAIPHLKAELNKGKLLTNLDTNKQITKASLELAEQNLENPTINKTEEEIVNRALGKKQEQVLTENTVVGVFNPVAGG